MGGRELVAAAARKERDQDTEGQTKCECNWCKTYGLRDVIPQSQGQVEDLTLIREESVSEAGCRDEYHTVYESDRSSEDR
jgi:hypothetical protein